MRGTAKRGLGSKTIWGRARNFKYQLAKPPKIFSENMPSGAYFFMVSLGGVHNVFIYNMYKI